MQVEKLRSLIRESINEYIKEIDEAAETAAMEARIAKCDEAIQMRETKLANLESLEEVKDMVDETKVENIRKEIKELQKAKAKFEKAKEKKAAKKAGKGKKEVTTDAKTEDTPVDESDVMEKMEVEGDMQKEEALNESFLKMQKLAGVITEAQYNQKKKILVEAIGDFNAPGFAASIKENLKKMGYEVTDMKGSSIDSAKGDLEKAANEGKNLAVVGVLEWEDGEEVVAAISLNQKEKDGGMTQQKELKAKIHDLYAKDFTTRFNVGNNGRVLVIGIKDKK
jgi:hypothetical protein